MKLSKRIPPRTKTVKFAWCKKDFMEMSDRFRRIRKQIGGPAMDTCFWCGHPFANGEMMALAHPVGKLNKVLCQKCADELLASE